MSSEMLQDHCHSLGVTTSRHQCSEKESLRLEATSIDFTFPLGTNSRISSVHSAFEFLLRLIEKKAVPSEVSIHLVPIPSGQFNTRGTLLGLENSRYCKCGTTLVSATSMSFGASRPA